MIWRLSNPKVISAELCCPHIQEERAIRVSESMDRNGRGFSLPLVVDNGQVQRLASRNLGRFLIELFRRGDGHAVYRRDDHVERNAVLLRCAPWSKFAYKNTGGRNARRLQRFLGALQDVNAGVVHSHPADWGWSIAGDVS